MLKRRDGLAITATNPANRLSTERRATMKIRVSMLALGIGLVVAVTAAGYVLNQAHSGPQDHAHPLPRLIIEAH